MGMATSVSTACSMTATRVVSVSRGALLFGSTLDRIIALLDLLNQPEGEHLQSHTVLDVRWNATLDGGEVALQCFIASQKLSRVRVDQFAGVTAKHVKVCAHLQPLLEQWLQLTW